MRSSPRRLLASLVALFLLAPAATGGDRPLGERLQTHLRFLASDELAGRLVGQPGNRTAARYIAEQFRAHGVEPLRDGDFLLPIPLVGVSPPSEGGLSFGEIRLEVGRDVAVLAGSAEGLQLSAAAADLGARAAIPEGTLDGKAVISSLRALRGFGRLTRRRARAISEGAAALVEIYLGDDWDRLQKTVNRTRIETADAGAGSETIPHVIVRDPGQQLLRRLRDDPSLEIAFNIPPPIREPLAAHNVGGLIRGSLPELADEYVVLAAHFDHVGAGSHLPGATAEDSIFNGARDNAMGVVALLAAAEQLAADPPARSVVLLAFNAEEQGILGSTHYIQNPAVPLGQTVFVLNTDGGGFTDREAVTLIGKGRTDADPVIVKACAELGLRVLPSPPGSNLFQRSDNIGFARLGVPALTFSPGFERFDPETMPHYHRPSDEVGPDFDFDYLETFALAFSRTARRLANRPARPTWDEAQPYSAAARELYRERP